MSLNNLLNSIFLHLQSVIKYILIGWKIEINLVILIKVKHTGTVYTRNRLDANTTSIFKGNTARTFELETSITNYSLRAH